MPFVLLFLAFYFTILGNAFSALIPIERRYVQLLLFFLLVILLIVQFKKNFKDKVLGYTRVFLKYFVLSLLFASPSLFNLFHDSATFWSLFNFASACLYVSVLLSVLECKPELKYEVKNKHVAVLFIAGVFAACVAYFMGPNAELDAHIDFKGSSILLGSLSVISIYCIHFYFFSKGWKYLLPSMVYAFPYYYLLFLSTSRGAIFIYIFIAILFLLKALYFAFKERRAYYLVQFVMLPILFLSSFGSIFIRSDYYPYYSFSNQNPALSVELRNLEFMLRYSRFLRFVNDYLSEETRERIRKYIEARTAIALRENYESMGKDRLQAGLGTNLNTSDERFEMYREFFRNGAPWNGFWPKPYKQYTKVDCGGGVGLCEYPHNLLIEAYFNYGILFFILSFIAIFAINLLAAYHILIATEIMLMAPSIAVIVLSLLSMYTSKFSDYLVYTPVFLFFAFYKKYQVSFLAMITNLKQNFLKKSLVKTFESK